MMINFKKIISYIIQFKVYTWSKTLSIPLLVFSEHVESPAIPVFLLRLLLTPFYISTHNLA
jgi:hypothetical protein